MKNDNTPWPNDQSDYIQEVLKGVDPVDIASALDSAYDQLQELKRTSVNHSIHQEGPYLVCSSCERRHTVKFIGPNRSFKGFDKEGNAIIEKRF